MEVQFLEKLLVYLALYSWVDDHIEPPVKPQAEKLFRELKLTRWVNKVNDEIGTTPGFSNIPEQLGDRGVGLDKK